MLSSNSLRHQDWNKFLIPLLVVMESADGILTYSATGKGLVIEANPLLKNITGTSDFLLMKILAGFGCALLLWLMRQRFPKISFITTCSILIFYGIIFMWNIIILSKFGLV